MKDVTQVYGTTPENLQQAIAQAVKEELADLKKHFEPKKPEEYLTRNQVKELFQVDMSTIHNWTKSGKLKPYGFGARVYFKRSDIEAGILPIAG